MSNPYQIPKGAPGQGNYGSYGQSGGTSVCQPLADKAIWMQLMGWPMLVLGILYSLTIVGAIGGIPMAIMGWNLKEAARKYTLGVPHDANMQFQASNHLGTFFLINGIMVLIGLVLSTLYILFVISIMFLAAAGAAGAAGGGM